MIIFVLPHSSSAANEFCFAAVVGRDCTLRRALFSGILNGSPFIESLHLVLYYLSMCVSGVVASAGTTPAISHD